MSWILKRMLQDPEQRLRELAMMISGLVLTLDSQPSGAVDTIRSRPHLTLGEQNGRLLSIAIEANTPAESEELHNWLIDVPGVENVEVVFVHRDDAEDGHVSD